MACTYLYDPPPNNPTRVIAGQVGTVAAAAVEGLVWAWWHSIAVPPPVFFSLVSGLAGIFIGENNMVGGEMPGITVLI